MSEYQYSKDIIYLQVFSLEILKYFDSIATKENSIWIDKYFNILMKKDNETAEKFNEHHIRPCFTFKDKTHKNRKEVESLANKFQGNLIKLSIYNHLFAHFYLWKIFNNRDSKISFQGMCGMQYSNITEDELKNIAKLKEDCAKTNIIKDSKQYYKIWRNNNKTRIKILYKEYCKNNKEKISEQNKIKYIKNRERYTNYRKQYNQKNKDKIKITNKIYYKKNKDKIHQQSKLYSHQLCFDPIKQDYCTLDTLFSRKKRHRELYQNIAPSKCLIKS